MKFTELLQPVAPSVKGGVRVHSNGVTKAKVEKVAAVPRRKRTKKERRRVARERYLKMREWHQLRYWEQKYGAGFKNILHFDVA